LGRPCPCSRDAVTGAGDRRQRPPLGADRRALKGRAPLAIIWPRQTGQSASRGPPTKTYRPGPPGFVAEIWGPKSALLDPACPPCRWGLRPPAFPSEHLAFGQTLGRGWRTGPLGQVGRPLVRAAEPRPCGPQGKRTPRLPPPYASILLTHYLYKRKVGAALVEGGRK
jgi:hypothetical protein